MGDLRSPARPTTRLEDLTSGALVAGVVPDSHLGSDDSADDATVAAEQAAILNLTSGTPGLLLMVDVDRQPVEACDDEVALDM